MIDARTPSVIAARGLILVQADPSAGGRRSRITTHAIAPQNDTFRTIRNTTIADRTANGYSANPVRPNTRLIAAKAGQAGHAHGPYHDNSVMARPMRELMKARLMILRDEG